MTYISIAFLLLGFMCGCTSKSKKTQEKDFGFIDQEKIPLNTSPYEVYLNSFTLENVTDTILVQRKSRVFFCGTGALEYYGELDKKGVRPYFTQYGDLVAYPGFVEKMESNYNAKILWVDRGNEGELMQLEEKTIRVDTLLEKRLFKQKLFVHITENPISMDSVMIYTAVNYPENTSTVLFKHLITKKKDSWRMEATERVSK